MYQKNAPLRLVGFVWGTLILGEPLRSSARSEEWWLEMDLNHRPDAYETPALTTELSSPGCGAGSCARSGGL